MLKNKYFYDVLCVKKVQKTFLFSKVFLYCTFRHQQQTAFVWVIGIEKIK